MHGPTLRLQIIYPHLIVLTRSALVPDICQVGDVFLHICKAFIINISAYTSHMMLFTGIERH